MDALSKEIGIKQPVVQSAVMVVTDVLLRIVDSAGGKEIVEVCGEVAGGKKYVLSKAKVRHGKNLAVLGLWVSEDDKGLIHSLSTLAVLLRHYGVKKASDLVGKKVELVLDDMFMVIKAY